MSFHIKPFDANLLDRIPAGIVVLDRLNGNVPIFVNKKAREDLQLTDEKELSKDLFLEFLDPSTRKKFERLSSSKFLPEVSEWKGVTIEGKPTWVQLRVVPLNENYYIVVIRNIGKIKHLIGELSETEAQYKALMEKDPNFLFILKNGVLEYYNQAFIDKLGYSAEEIDQQKRMPTFFVTPPDREKIARFLIQTKREIMTGLVDGNNINHNKYHQPDETTEFDLLCKDGSRIPVYAIVKNVSSGKDVIIQGVLIDLSPINELHEMKLDFLTLTQHYLRTPLSTLKGYLDFYKKRIKDGISSNEKEILEKKLMDVFSRNVDRMVSLSEDLNDIALIRRGKLKSNLRGESFIPILQQMVDDLQYLIHQNRVNLIVEYPTIPYIINLDRNRISQALRNVLENAIRFTGHGTVEIIISIENDNQDLMLTIKDDGVGIDSHNLEEIGKPFMTFHPAASRLGLGLYLTKEIISDHGGTLEISSLGFNQGTTVIIVLPLLVTSDEEITSSIKRGGNVLTEMIRIATTSENMVKRMESLQKLGNGSHSGPELDNVISTLEKIILYDKDRTIRNLASKFYAQKVEIKKNATSDAT